ncbi:MAG TPA: Crp/Fnr family transcriptional regulator [Acidimicrobiales bacterium]|nr:Crp/Fnr family transcriptional regulator [Acidimicrobiales bacterium]
MDRRDVLASSDLVAVLDREAVDRVAGETTALTLHRNDMVFTEGGPAAALYVVAGGRVAISKRSPDERESMVALMETGDLFGEMGLLDDQGRSADARALERSELVAVSYDAIRTELDRRPQLLWNLIRLLAQRLRATDAALADAMFLDVTGRTAKRLLELAGEADEFVLPVTQEELAGLVGASRERVNKAIATLVRLGFLEQVDRRYRILDRAELAHRAR